jgi:predicted nucleotidyltransferase
MMEDVELDRLREAIMAVLGPYNVRRVSLFGSVVRGENRPGSDLDILVALPPPGERPVIGLKWFDLSEQLEAALQRPVDLVTEDGLSPFIRPHIEEEKVVLYERT